MRKFIGLLLAAVMALSVTACGSKVQETVEIDVIKNEQAITTQKLEIPLELKNYQYVYLKSFDGRYAVFTIERVESIGNSTFAGDTGRIVVYDVQSEMVVHMVNLNLPGYKVSDAVKKGDNLYYSAYSRTEMKEQVYINNGLENILIKETDWASATDFSRFEVFGEDIVLVKNNGSIDDYDYQFFLLKDGSFEPVYTFRQQNKGFITVIDYTDSQFVISETDISDENYININIWNGQEKETVFSLANEHGHSFAQLGEVFIHPVDNSGNEGQYKMVAVTDIKSGGVTEIGMLQGGFLGTYKNKGLMYTYGKSDEQILLFESEGNTLEITPLDISADGRDVNIYHMTEETALLKIGNLNETEFELYLLEY